MMSKYTTEVRYICEYEAGYTESQGSNDVDTVIAKSWKNVLGTAYPIFNEEYRKTLSSKILKHYYTREIGYETVGLWKLKMQTKLNEVMPYFNQLYESELLKIEPLEDVNYTRSGNRDNSTSGSTSESSNGSIGNTQESTTNTTQSGSSSSSDTAKNYFSNTPQGTIANVEDNTYLTSATVDRNTNSNSSSGQGKTTASANSNTSSNESRNSNNSSSGKENYSETIKGKTAGKSFSKLLQEYRETFLNIDMLVIDSLADLFLNLW